MVRGYERSEAGISRASGFDLATLDPHTMASWCALPNPNPNSNPDPDPNPNPKANPNPNTPSRRLLPRAQSTGLIMERVKLLNPTYPSPKL